MQDLFLTETAIYADVVLPASAWPEKDGTVTNTNRQVQMGRTALPLPGDARQDWWIVQEIARRIGLDWRYEHPRDVFAEMAPAMPSLANITWARLGARARSPIPATRRTQPATTSYSATASRPATAAAGSRPPTSCRRPSCRTRPTRWCYPPGASSSTGTPAR